MIGGRETSLMVANARIAELEAQNKELVDAVRDLVDCWGSRVERENYPPDSYGAESVAAGRAAIRRAEGGA